MAVPTRRSTHLPFRQPMIPSRIRSRSSAPVTDSRSHAPGVRALALTLAPSARAADPPPLFAYYYIWFNPSSWNRAKIDYPTLGRYSSDDIAVMRKHVAWAKSAGIDGFLVSWKHTETLDRRLAKLIRVADSMHFKLGIVYQGLDFRRNPLPATRVAADLRLFRQRYARDRAFSYFSKPIVIWAGTWKFTTAQIASVVRAQRSKLSI